VKNLLVNRDGGLSGIVRGGRHLRPRPFSEDREEAGNILADLMTAENIEAALSLDAPTVSRRSDG
jgi:hypothetical protein